MLVAARRTARSRPSLLTGEAVRGQRPFSIVLRRRPQICDEGCQGACHAPTLVSSAPVDPAFGSIVGPRDPLDVDMRSPQGTNLP